MRKRFFINSLVNYGWNYQKFKRILSKKTKHIIEILTKSESLLSKNTIRIYLQILNGF